MAMLPLHQTNRMTTTHVGRLLLTEARVRAARDEAARLRCDPEQALALALIDAAHRAGAAGPAVIAFAQAQAAAYAEAAPMLTREVGWPAASDPER
jgi:alpha-D-ribose 1-methylphosphonate 5-triphosphate synthase subunit PhnG